MEAIACRSARPAADVAGAEVSAEVSGMATGRHGTGRGTGPDTRRKVSQPDPDTDPARRVFGIRRTGQHVAVHTSRLRRAPLETTRAIRPHAATALPPAVTEEEWQAARDELLVEEKAHTRAGDAIAAKRRRLPMVEVDAELEVEGANGRCTLLEMFEGRRQLIVYHHMLKPDDPHPCPGCSAFTDYVPHLAHLNVQDVTFAMESAAPVDQFQAYMRRMGREDIPVYSSAASAFREQLHPSPHGPTSFGLSVFVRDGERVYRTYATQGRGVDGTPLLDVTVFGRQESFEDSPDGWPQRPTYSFGKVHDEYTPDELAELAAPSTTGQTS